MIGVVSATPNVGKSFISANVSAALSRDPRFQTYVVDLDLRRGSLSDFFGLSPDRGVSDYLQSAPGADVPSVYHLEGERLLIMPTAAGRIHSAELIASERAQTLLRSMRVSDEKNLFIVDLPPVFANDDASTAMARLDAYIVVAEEGKTKQREIQDAVGLLGEARLAGVILNKYRGGVVSEGYGVDDYYAAGYGAAEAERQELRRQTACLLLRRRRSEPFLIFDLRGLADSLEPILHELRGLLPAHCGDRHRLGLLARNRSGLARDDDAGHGHDSQPGS